MDVDLRGEKRLTGRGGELKANAREDAKTSQIQRGKTECNIVISFT